MILYHHQKRSQKSKIILQNRKVSKMHVAFAPVLMITLVDIVLLFYSTTIFCSFCLAFPFPLAFGSLSAGKSLDILMAMSLVGRFLKWLRNCGRKGARERKKRNYKQNVLKYLNPPTRQEIASFACGCFCYVTRKKI